MGIIKKMTDLTIAKSHMGNITASQQGAQFTLAVTNGGSGASSGTITVTDSLPSGLTFASGTGTGWSCMANGPAVSCSNGNVISGNGGTSAITLNVNVAANAPASVSNTAAVACTCAESNTNNNTSNTDMVTVINGTPVLMTVNPNTGQQGQQNESVNLTSVSTHWVQGTTTASFGAGITVATLTINSATTATAVLNIDPAAETGARKRKGAAKAEGGTPSSGRIVNKKKPAINPVDPNTRPTVPPNEVPTIN